MESQIKFYFFMTSSDYGFMISIKDKLLIVITPDNVMRKSDLKTSENEK